MTTEQQIKRLISEKMFAEMQEKYDIYDLILECYSKFEFEQQFMKNTIQEDVIWKRVWDFLDLKKEQEQEVLAEADIQEEDSFEYDKTYWDWCID